VTPYRSAAPQERSIVAFGDRALARVRSVAAVILMGIGLGVSGWTHATEPLILVIVGIWVLGRWVEWGTLELVRERQSLRIVHHRLWPLRSTRWIPVDEIVGLVVEPLVEARVRIRLSWDRGIEPDYTLCLVLHGYRKIMLLQTFTKDELERDAKLVGDFLQEHELLLPPP
jgi:hypothetical protein